jgi:hypothetical protein
VLDPLNGKSLSLKIEPSLPTDPFIQIMALNTLALFDVDQVDDDRSGAQMCAQFVVGNGFRSDQQYFGSLNDLFQITAQQRPDVWNRLLNELPVRTQNPAQNDIFVVDSALAGLAKQSFHKIH